MGFTLDLSGFKLYPWQQEVLRNLRNRNVIIVPRQTGKTVLLKYVLASCSDKRGREYMYITPTLKRSGKVFKEFSYALPEDQVEIRKVDKEIVFPNSPPTHFGFASTEQSKGLRGGTVWGGILDECQLMDRGDVNEAILPMFSATGGWLIYCGTPPDPLDCPDPFFFEETFERAKSSLGLHGQAWGIHSNDEWCLVHLDYRIRADVDPIYARMVEEARDSISEDGFNREYMALFTKKGEGSFITDDIKWYEHPRKLESKKLDVMIHVDPSFKETEASDPRGLAVTGICEDGNLYVLDCQAGKWTYSAFIDKLFVAWDWCCGLGHAPVCLSLETNGAGEPFYQNMLMEIRRRHHPMRIRPITSTKSKYNRILSLEPWVRQGRLYLPSRGHKTVGIGSRSATAELVLEQMEEFPRGLLFRNTRMKHHYDALDALAQRTLDWPPPPRRRAEPAVTKPGGKLVLTFGDQIRKAMKRGRVPRNTWRTR